MFVYSFIYGGFPITASNPDLPIFSNSSLNPSSVKIFTPNSFPISSLNLNIHFVFSLDMKYLHLEIVFEEFISFFDIFCHECHQEFCIKKFNIIIKS